MSLNAVRSEAMHVLFFTHYYPPEGNAPATRVAALARRWVALGHQVTVITCAPNVPNGEVYEGYRNTLRPQESMVDGVRVIRVWTYLAPNKGMVRRIFNYLSYMVSAWLRAMLLQRPDVVVATSPQFFCGWAGVLTKWGLRVRDPFKGTAPFVLEIRDIWPESIGAVDAMQNSRVLGVLGFLEKRMYGAARRVVTVGPGYRRRLEERGVPERKLEIVMNGVDREFQQLAQQGAVPEAKSWEGKIVCAYVGTIGMACGLEVLLRAGRLLKEQKREDVVLVAIGDGAVRSDLVAEAAREGLDNVQFLGRRPKDLIPAYLERSDVCLVHLKKTPLFESVMPSKIFEAAGARRPILNGVNGDARTLIEQAQAGLCFEPEDEEGLVRGLLTLADDSGLRSQLGDDGFRYVHDHFDREVLADQYLELLVEVAA